MGFGFILKKIVSWSLMPIPLGMALILIALFFLVRNKKRKAIGILTAAFVWFSLLSYTPFANYMLYQFESAYPPLLQAPREVRYIYVLGGGHKSDNALPITSQVYDDAIIRLNEAIRLYHQLDEKATIIVSGYSGFYSDIPHANMQQKLAVALGINPENITLRPKPMDTQEEAKAAKELLRDKPFILVTSAFHMDRAMRWFRQEGLNPVPAPAHHFTSSNQTAYWGFFSSHALMMSTHAFHEALGVLWQKIKG